MNEHGLIPVPSQAPVALNKIDTKVPSNPFTRQK